MSDRMTPIPFDKLMEQALSEYREEGSLFGVKNGWRADETTKKLSLFSGQLETPFGPAAGPHTQLAQNILTAYWAGGRFFELKTVQTLDGENLHVDKPCILAADEGYNVEWSTELTVEQAMEEYIKAWFAIKLLSWELALGSDDGFIFNMSVGYDYEGITSPKIDGFIEGLKDASGTAVFKECTAYALNHLHLFKRVDAGFVKAISPRVCSSITLSTLHGCPPSEIQKIASHLISVKKLHTCIKLNPTLVGYDYARKALDAQGYDYLVFDDHHFKHDLQLPEAIRLVGRLKKLAMDAGVVFGVKLTNTFPVKITRKELPGKDMYLSGKALFPLTIRVAQLLAGEVGGDLLMSYSGGADFFNLTELLRGGIWPVTFSTTLLKPGGYARLHQMADSLSRELPEGPALHLQPQVIENLEIKGKSSDYYHKGPDSRQKLARKVPLLNCYTAPCRAECPIKLDIPGYFGKAAVNDSEGAGVLMAQATDNPAYCLSCPQPCKDRCVRSYYESPVNIKKVVEVFKAGLPKEARALPIRNEALPKGYEAFSQAPLKEEAAARGWLISEGEGSEEGRRCLQCARVCELCAEVCPNRANVSLSIPGRPMRQILHLDALCNECGNCTVFCPYDSSPYREKFTLFATEKDFLESPHSGFYIRNKENRQVLVRLNGKIQEGSLLEGTLAIPGAFSDFIRTVLDKYSYLI